MKTAFLAGVIMAIGWTVAASGATPSFADFGKRAEAGEKLTVVFFGGSLTWGAKATDPMRTSYRALVGRKLEDAYPKSQFRFVDAAIGGSGAQLGAFRLQRDVLAYHPDLVFLDFTLNDGVYETTPDTLAAHESLIRRMILDGHCPVVQMFLAAKSFISDEPIEKMKRRTAHQAIAQAYHVPNGDAIEWMRAKWKAGLADLDVLWTPESFDTTHPDDPGYALYAEAAWDAFQKAVADKIVCSAPEKMLHADTYMHWSRVRLSSLAPLPPGWRVTFPTHLGVAFDFTMSRWLDDVTAAANFLPLDRVKTRPTLVPQPLNLRFLGSSALLFGESTPRSCKYRVTVDGKASELNACVFGQDGNGRLWVLIAEGLDAAKEHTLEIRPLIADTEKPQELRLESLCVAGGEAKVWVDQR